MTELKSACNAALSTHHRSNIHTLMENTDYPDLLAAHLLVKNHMTSLREYPMSRSDLITGSTNLRVFS